MNMFCLPQTATAVKAVLRQVLWNNSVLMRVLSRRITTLPFRFTITLVTAAVL